MVNSAIASDEENTLIKLLNIKTKKQGDPKDLPAIVHLKLKPSLEEERTRELDRATAVLEPTDERLTEENVENISIPIDKHVRVIE